MCIAHHFAFLTPDNQHYFGVRLKPDHTKYNLNTGSLQSCSKLNISLFIKARSQFDNHRHIFTIMGRFY